MPRRLTLEKYSAGLGDRFGLQGKAQLRACFLALERGVRITPVWNKSNREHLLVGSEPAETRREADEAVVGLAWPHPYHVDADHIRLDTVDRFLPHCDFFTIDVAESIGQVARPAAVDTFLKRHPELQGNIDLPGLPEPIPLPATEVTRAASKYLSAAEEAGRIYRDIAARSHAPADCLIEVSMDETENSQTPSELLVILAALADQQLPLQTIAPKFTGRFNKGVEYVGDVEQFEREFAADIAVIAWAVRQYHFSESLKLSVHSGSDKFSLYPIISRLMKQTGTGVHLKTAGTTWLEEVIGLAEAGGEGLALVKEIYCQGLAQRVDLCAPYATVLNIDQQRLPTASVVNAWTSEQFVRAVRHDPADPQFNPHLRQLLHVSYRIAAQMGERFRRLLKENEKTIRRNVIHNLFNRHFKPLFCS